MGIYYVDKFDGYVADTPNLDFERCDGTVFPFYEVNSANFTDTMNFQTVQGGQGIAPLAYIPSDRTTEFSFESSQFSADIFAMANGVDIETGDFGTRETGRFKVTGGKITINHECKTGSVRIRGLKETTGTATAGTFVVTITTANTTTAGKTEISLFAGDFETDAEVRVSYIRRVNKANRVMVKTTSTSARGALTAHYPVYSSGSDCTDAAIKGWLHFHMPRCRVTQMPGFDASYKSAATNGLTFSSIDGKLASGEHYDIIYEPTVGSSEINNIASSTTVTWTDTQITAGNAASGTQSGGGSSPQQQPGYEMGGGLS